MLNDIVEDERFPFELQKNPSHCTRSRQALEPVRRQQRGGRYQRPAEFVSLFARLAAAIYLRRAAVRIDRENVSPRSRGAPSSLIIPSAPCRVIIESLPGLT
jgi:hypothetical protein